MHVLIYMSIIGPCQCMNKYEHSCIDARISVYGISFFLPYVILDLDDDIAWRLHVSSVFRSIINRYVSPSNSFVQMFPYIIPFVSFGFSPASSQLLTVPPYVFASKFSAVALCGTNLTLQQLSRLPFQCSPTESKSGHRSSLPGILCVWLDFLSKYRMPRPE